MAASSSLGRMLLDALAAYPVIKEDIGQDARLSKSGMTFETERYEIRGLGHLCVMRMKAMLGLMKMETAVLSVYGKDVPLFNLDYVRAMGKETQMAELYDVQLAQAPDALLARLQARKDRDADLPDRARSPHWYDDILYPCSYDKSGKRIGDRLSSAAKDYIAVFSEYLASAPDCDAAKKKEKIRGFAETLYAKGGPAVDQVKKLFGDETAKRLILSHMYGVRD